MKIMSRFIILMCCTFIGLIAVTTWDARAEENPCVDVTLQFHAVLDPADKVFCVEGPVANEILSYRGAVDELSHRYADLWGETHTTITNLNFHIAELDGEVQSLKSKIERKDAKIAELRQRLRNQ